MCWPAGLGGGVSGSCNAWVWATIPVLLMGQLDKDPCLFPIIIIITSIGLLLKTKVFKSRPPCQQKRIENNLQKYAVMKPILYRGDGRKKS